MSFAIDAELSAAVRALRAPAIITPPTETASRIEAAQARTVGVNRLGFRAACTASRSRSGAG